MHLIWGAACLIILLLLSHALFFSRTLYECPQVATCSGANAIDPWAGALVGVLGAIVTQSQVLLFNNVLFIDDPLNASAVHLGAGATGMIWVAFMANPDYAGEEFTGIFYGGEFKFLGYQFYGMFCYAAWTFLTSGAMFFGLNSIGWFRVSEDEEDLGVDKSHHGGSAYPTDDEHMTQNDDSIGGSDVKPIYIQDSEEEEVMVET